MAQTSGPAVAGADRSHWGRASIVVALIGVGLSYGSFQLVLTSHVREVEANFERAALDRFRAIEEDLNHSVEMLDATAAYLETSRKPSRAEFASFASHLLANHPGVAGLSWIARVSNAQRASFEAATRAEVPTFQITEIGESGELMAAARRRQYFPVVYIEPMGGGNQRALGYDIASDAVRRRALERAASTGEAAATARIRLVQETGEQYSILIVRSLDGPQAQTAGFVTEVVRVGDLVERSLSRLEPGGVDVGVYDASGDREDGLLHFHPSRTRGGTTRDLELEDARLNALHRADSFEIAGRRWQLAATPAPGRFSMAIPWQAYNALVLGLALTSVLVAYLQLLRRQSIRQRRESLRLKQKVDERSEELERVHRDLLRQERLATLGQLTGTVAHEMRNPLSALSMSFELLWHKIEGRSPEVERALRRAQRNIERCDHIITELLDFTRARGPEVLPTPLGVWLANLLDEYATPDGVTIERDFPVDGVVVELDSHLMRRAVVNLLDNACQAFDDEKPRADRGSDPERPRVRVEIREQADRVQIVITDNGPGIPLEIGEEVFEPLFSTKSFGVGLGLATVRQIIEQHGGEVTLDGASGNGTCAVLSLPRSAVSGVSAGRDGS